MSLYADCVSNRKSKLWSGPQKLTMAAYYMDGYITEILACRKVGALVALAENKHNILPWYLLLSGIIISESGPTELTISKLYAAKTSYS